MYQQVLSLFQMFPWSVATGVIVAACCAVLGVFVILRRVVFIGITLSEVAACGIAAAMVLGVPPFVGAATLTLAAVVLLAQPFEVQNIPRDALLGVIFVAAGAGSVMLVSQSGFGLHEVKMLLYGDLILASRTDFALIAAALVPVLCFVLLCLRPILYSFMDREVARTMGLRVRLWELAFFAGLGLAVSAASKVAGTLLVFCYLVVAPAAALLLIRRLGWVLILAVAVGVSSTLSGVLWSFSKDLPTNQTISLVMCMMFALALLLHWILWGLQLKHRPTVASEVELEGRKNGSA